ncbi:glycosyltransferase family 25 protein [Aquibium sp. ELW1220]|uniref:glycosyltransferase family 25 protein n=1 Tax=Aquibium sp. ELW1220 TaxID=2976766 RepID=UPI0025B105CB|nr:glycosyltransferase family 25 protein [Aquibium sp. ELW1220]MDN2580140.1 glycosyltransferase family 25 protein [Aquibium sp. ELW1220]
MKAYVIHLKDAPGRLPQVERLAQRLPIPCQILDAVAGARLSDRERDAAYRRTIHWPPYPFRLSKGEIGCFLSHRLSWQAIVDEGTAGGLVLEDDVEVDMARLPAALELVKRFASPGDIVRFPNKFRSAAGQVVAAADGLEIVRENSPGLNMMMQWIGRDAARELLARTERFDRPVDVFVQMRWLHRLPVYALRPVLIREISGQLGGSTIQASNKSLLREVARGVSRTAYRGFTRTRNLFV